MKGLQIAAILAALGGNNQLDSLVQMPKRQKPRMMVRVLHDCTYGGTAITAAGVERMKARRAAYVTDTDLLSNTQQKALKLIRCKGNCMHGITAGNSKYHVQYNKLAAIRANFKASEL